jgi:hydrogenase maturation protease
VLHPLRQSALRMTFGAGTRMAIIGIGNPMMGDDGIGPRLIAELDGVVPGADLIDMGTGGMQLVHVLARYDAVVIVDAADMGLSPGESRVFAPEDAVSLKETRAYSLHDWDLMRSIEISRQLGEAPEKILIFAVQPGCLELREGLSPEVERGIPGYVAEAGTALASVRA